MKKIAIVYSTLILLGFALAGCERENLGCSDDKEFCSFVEKEEYGSTLPIIDEYLAGQKKGLSDDEKLEQLIDWLECKSCISSVGVRCNSCILTNPSQSELMVAFMVNGTEREMCLDVIMDKPLRTRTYHE